MLVCESRREYYSLALLSMDSEPIIVDHDSTTIRHIVKISYVNQYSTHYCRLSIYMWEEISFAWFILLYLW